MNFFTAIKTCFGKYATFEGRARRSEYWWWAVFSFLVGLLGMIPVLGWILAVAIFLPGLAVAVRRLHDTGRSGWWYLLVLLPLLGAIILIVFFVQDSKPGDNQYGPNPKGVTA